MKRREFIKLSAATSASLGFLPQVFAREAYQLREGYSGEINLSAAPKKYQLLEGNMTQMWSFKGQVLSGNENLLTNQLGYLGPKIEVRKGQKIKINFKNNLPEKSIVHWHGLHINEANDGHPSYAIEPGETYNYELHIQNRAGLYWYHPHPHGRTGFQVYQGLAGLFVIRDEEEGRLNLPAGENELFFVFQDRELDENNQLVYIKSMHDKMMGKIGNKLFVNGASQFQKEVKAESYRLRILNGSNALFYNLRWDDGRPLTIIGTDGGLIEKPEDRENVLISPGERLDILVNFENNKVNDKVTLQSAPIVDNGQSEPFTLHEFHVTEEGIKKFKLPEQLSVVEKIPISEAVNTESVKSFRIQPVPGKGWTIDGLNYEMDNIRPKERIKLGTTEIWEFDHTHSGMVHPMHVHGSQFQVIERISGPFSKGLVFDQGWKDTVSLLPGDKVRVIKRFHEFSGKFLLHCHMYEPPPQIKEIFKKLTSIGCKMQTCIRLLNGDVSFSEP